MGKINVRHLRKKASGYYWEPSASLKNLGFSAVPLGKRKGRAVRVAEYWNGEADKAREKVFQPSETYGTISWVINQYCKSTRFTKLRGATQKGYLQNLGIIKKFAGDKQPEKLRPKIIERWYDKIRETSPSSANAVMRVLSIIMDYALLEDLIDQNPVKHIKRTSVPPRQGVWSVKEIDDFIQVSCQMNHPSLGLALRLAADTGQRQGDILSLTWGQYEDGSLSFTQSKTGVKVAVKVTPDIQAALKNKGADSDKIIISETTKQEYTGDHFRHLFSKIRTEAKVNRELQFRDLRRTAVVRLALSGATIAEIVSITGHTLASATNILSVYLPKHTKMAEHGITKLINFESNNLQ